MKPAERERWDEIGNALLDMADELEALAAEAAQLVGSLPAQARLDLKSLDPRKSQLKGALFASTLSYEATTLRRKGESIEEGIPDGEGTEG